MEVLLNGNANTVDLLVLTSLDQLIFILKIIVNSFTKRATLAYLTLGLDVGVHAGPDRDSIAGERRRRKVGINGVVLSRNSADPVVAVFLFLVVAVTIKPVVGWVLQNWGWLVGWGWLVSWGWFVGWWRGYNTFFSSSLMVGGNKLEHMYLHFIA